jgi:hypothetical protein
MKPTRLNNDMREAFIEAVMADVPEIDYAEKIRSAVNKAAHAALPPAVKKLLAAEDTARFVNTCGTTLNKYDGLPEGYYVSFRLPAENSDALDKIANEHAKPFAAAWTEQIEARETLRAKLSAVARHCTTRKQLAEAFPEFERYLPADETAAIQNLPALANVVSDFVKAGWPKDKKGARK